MGSRDSLGPEESPPAAARSATRVDEGGEEYVGIARLDVLDASEYATDAPTLVWLKVTHTPQHASRSSGRNGSVRRSHRPALALVA